MIAPGLAAGLAAALQPPQEAAIERSSGTDIPVT